MIFISNSMSIPLLVLLSWNWFARPSGFRNIDVRLWLATDSIDEVYRIYDDIIITRDIDRRVHVLEVWMRLIAGIRHGTITALMVAYHDPRC